jgi:hypothetical protein
MQFMQEQEVASISGANFLWWASTQADYTLADC